MATTRDKVREKLVDMIENDLPSILIEKVDKLLDSGAINYERYEDNYLLPKLIMQALGSCMTRLYSHPYATAKEKKEIKKFGYFI